MIVNNHVYLGRRPPALPSRARDAATSYMVVDANGNSQRYKDVGQAKRAFVASLRSMVKQANQQDTFAGKQVVLIGQGWDGAQKKEVSLTGHGSVRMIPLYD